MDRERAWASWAACAAYAAYERLRMVVPVSLRVRLLSGAGLCGVVVVDDEGADLRE